MNRENVSEWEKLRSFEKAFETMQLGVTITDIEGKIIYTNPAEAQMHGYTVEELLGQDVRIFAPPERWNPMTLQKIKAIKRLRRESINIRKDGSTFPVQIMSDAVTDAAGNPIGIVTTCEDITERKLAEEALQKAHEELEKKVQKRTAALSETIGFLEEEINERKRVEKALRDSEERYRLLFESSPDPLWVYDLETFTFLTVNEAAIRHYGYTKEEFLAMTIVDILPAEDIPDLLDRVLTASTKLGESDVRKHRKKDGTVIHVEITSHPLIFAGRHARLVLAHDITERKKLIEGLEKINRCFLDFGADFMKNINRLTALCGELLGADCALYHRFDTGMLCSAGQWQTLAYCQSVDKPEGHICDDVIKKAGDEVLVVSNLSQTAYALTDPNVAAYNIQTYIGKAVKWRGAAVGSLCMVYQKNFVPSEAEKKLMGIIAAAIGTEEERQQAQQA